MTNDEITALQIFASDPVLFNAVFAIFRAHVEKQRDSAVSLAMLSNESNEAIGAHFKAHAEAIRLVEKVFREIGAFKPKTIQAKFAVNPGR